MKAFPQKYPIDPDEPHHWKHNPLDTGMDLRDYFAAKAMQGLLSNPKLQEQILKQGQDWIIESSYAWANSMMKERENDNQ
jgi:hypothetical protein